MDKVSRVGIDLAKKLFHVTAVDDVGTVLERKRLRRAGLQSYLSMLPTGCAIALEACGGAHHWGRLAIRHGHKVLMMSPQFVVPYPSNQSPLYRLFQAFRRSSPQGKNGLWSRILVVKNNDRAQQMADEFSNDDPEYLTDERWWNLVEEQDKEILRGPAEPDDEPGIPGGIVDEPDDDPPPGEPDTPEPPAPPPPRRTLHDLTRKYVHPTFRVEYEIQAYAVQTNDPDMIAGAPWAFYLDDVATRTYAFLVDLEHDIYQSTTMTPLDGLLTELSHRTVDFLKGQAQEVTIAGVLADFRRQYCVDTRLDPQEIISFATTVLEEIARAIPNLIAPAQGTDLYAELNEAEKNAIAQRMANRHVPDHTETIADGRFWSYADFQSLRAFFSRHPELFLDGKYWEDGYETLDYGAPQITDDAKDAILSRFDAFLGDAVWLANQTPGDLERTSRDMIIRATCSLRLLRSDIAE